MEHALTAGPTDPRSYIEKQHVNSLGGCFHFVLRLKVLAGRVMDIEHDDILIADSKDDAVFTLPLAVEQFAELFGEFVALGRTRTACWLAGQRLHLLEETLIP